MSKTRDISKDFGWSTAAAIEDASPSSPAAFTAKIISIRDGFFLTITAAGLLTDRDLRLFQQPGCFVVAM